MPSKKGDSTCQAGQTIGHLTVARKPHPIGLPEAALLANQNRSVIVTAAGVQTTTLVWLAFEGGHTGRLPGLHQR